MLAQKHRLTTWISVLLIVGFLATNLASYLVASTQMKKGLADSILPLTGDNIYSEIQRDLIRPVFISSMMATDTFLRDWVLSGERDTAQITKYLTEIKSRYQAVACFFVSENTQTYYHAGGILKQIAADEPRDRWYFRVRAMKEPYELNLDKDLANQDALTIFINHRVYDYNSNFIGATGCGMAATAVAGLIENYERRYQRHILFVDKQGLVMFSAGRAGEQASMHSMDGLKAIAPDILNQDSGSFSYRRDGQTFMLNTRFVPELGWYLLVEQSLDRETRLLQRTLMFNLLICLVVSLIILTVLHITLSTYQDRLERLARTDKLTAVNNRYAGETLFEQAVRDARRQRTALSLILLDLDHFKNINDTYGHQAGDAVLKHCAATIQRCLRNADILCRWGGEEFLVVLKQCAAIDAFHLAEKIRQAIAKDKVAFRAEGIQVRVSLGVAQLQADETGEALLTRADSAMYRAKESGRNRTKMSD